MSVPFRHRVGAILGGALVTAITSAGVWAPLIIGGTP